MARTRPHVKVHLAVQHHERTAEIWANASERGMLVELWRTGVEQYAPKRGGRVELMPLDRLRIAGDPPPSIGIPVQSADDAVELLCKKLGYRLDKRPNRWTVTVRKFARKQGMGEEELPTKADSLSHERSPQNTEAEAEAESRKQKGETSDVPSSLGLPLESGFGSVPGKANGYVARARAVYPQVVETFGIYEKILRGTGGKDRIDLIAKRLEDGASEADLIAAIHGYVYENKGLDPDGKHDVRKFFRPSTIFKAEGFSDRVDAGQDPDAPIPERPTEPTFFEQEEDRREKSRAAYLAGDTP